MSSLVFQFLLLWSALSCCAAQCDMTTSTELKTSSDSFMTYVGDENATRIKCEVFCETCDIEFIYWLKDDDYVYSKFWDDPDTTGPEDGYEGKVKDELDQDGENAYVLEWIKTKWDDLLADQDFTKWRCETRVTSCGTLSDEADVEYFRFPVLSYYVNGESVDDFDDIKISEGTLNCSVISHPESRLTLMRGDEMVSDDSSCSSISQFESVCSVSVPEFDLSRGFHCKVEYNSPEVGDYDEVTPDGCCEKPMYPAPSTPTPTPLPPQTTVAEPKGRGNQCLAGWLTVLVTVVSAVYLSDRT